MFLQTPFSAFYYNNIPGANYIQFPWRLLSFSTVLSIFALCMSIFIITNNFNRNWLKNILFIALFLSTIYQFIFGISIPINYVIMRRSFIDNHLQKENLIFAEEPSEYLPKNIKIPARASALIEYNHTCRIIYEYPKGVTKKVIDASEIDIIVGGDCIIKYNQFINPFTKISFSSKGIIESSSESTYLLISNSEFNRISVKRIGLLSSLIKFYQDKETKFYE